MGAVLAIVPVVFVFAYFGEPDALAAFPYGQDKQRIATETKFFRDVFFVECPDDDAVESQLYGFQQHTLDCDAGVNVHQLAFGHGAAHDDESFRLGALDRQV